MSTEVNETQLRILKLMVEHEGDRRRTHGVEVSEYWLRRKLQVRSVPVKSLEVLVAKGYARKSSRLFHWTLTDTGRELANG